MTVVRVAAPDGTSGRRSAVPPPVRHRLDLAELACAARLAGELPLPVDVTAPATDDRVSQRLAGTPAPEARRRVEAARRRADDDGPAGARAGLERRGLLTDDGLDPVLDAGIRVLAAAPLSAVLDVAATRRSGTVRLRSWLGVTSGLVAQLATSDALAHELSCYDRRHWGSQLARSATVSPWRPEPAPLRLPDHVTLPSELLVGAVKARREHRADLLPAMAAAHVGSVLLGEQGRYREAAPEEVLALLRTLTDACRGRLRMLVSGRDPAPARGPAVASWVLLDDGWRELRPGRGATVVLRRREPVDLGLLTLPLVDSVCGGGGHD